MKVEIWSDVACPFCYIGKRRFERVLESFPDKDKVVVEWKSFLLDPSLPKGGKRKIQDYMAQQKGMSISEVKAMFQHVVEMAQSEGIEMNMDQIIMASTLDMHRLIQYAKTLNLGAEAEEGFFNAYFSGKDFTNESVLLETCKEIGLHEGEALNVINSDRFSAEVDNDIYEAKTIGVRGVPHFVFNDKYTVSGAQPGDVFKGALEKSYEEWNRSE